ncbi:MAG: OmpH family outer membrane protein [Crocinitomicaceae bacterium]
MSDEKTRKFKLSILNTVLLIAILSYLVIGNLDAGKSQGQVYVVTGELYAGFTYQQELDAEFEVIKQEKEADLMRFKNELSQMEQHVRTGKATDEMIQNYQYRFAEFQQYEQKINEDLSITSQHYNEKIWEKLNAFVKEYGEKQEYEVIFGASGSGNIMYAEEKMDVTEEVLAFCNKKYSGR